MEYKCLLGSKLLQLENCRDEDYVIFVNKKAREINDTYQRSIPFYKTIINYFIMHKTQDSDKHVSLMLYQLSSSFFEDEEYPFNFFNILNHKTVWIKQLKNFMNLEETEKWAMKDEMLHKWFYHILYQYYMIVEDVHFISDLAKADVQKIHDLEMPSSYFYELRNLINSL